MLAAQAEHVAAAADEDPSGPELPAAHGAPEHVEVPGADVKVPAAHAEHVAEAAHTEPSGPKLPAPQGVPAHPELLGTDVKEPAAHGVQLEAPAEE